LTSTVDVGVVDRPRAAGFSGERRLAAGGGGVLQIPRGFRILRPVGRHDDVIEAEGEHHRARELVLFLIAGHCPVAVGPQVLVEVAAVQIDQVIARLDDFLRDDKRRAIGLRAVRDRQDRTGSCSCCPSD
jgi:hypothetical protein